MPTLSFEFSVFSFQHLLPNFGYDPCALVAGGRDRFFTENRKLKTGNFLPYQLEQARAVALDVAGRRAQLARDVVLAHLRVGDGARDHVNVYAAAAEQLDAAPRADVVRRAEDDGRRRRAQLLVVKHGLDRVAAQYPVAQLDDDEVGRRLVELGDDGLRHGREVADADRRGQPAVEETRRRHRA